MPGTEPAGKGCTGMHVANGGDTPSLAARRLRLLLSQLLVSLYRMWATPRGWFLLASYQFVCAFFFVLVVHFTSSTNMVYFYRDAGLLLLVVAPVVCMDALSLRPCEQRWHLPAFESAPPLAVLIGRSAGPASFLLVCCASCAMYPFLLSFFAEVDWDASCAALLGLSALAWAVGSLSLACSALCPSPMTAASAAFILAMCCWCAGSLCGASTNPAIRCLAGLSFFSHTSSFFRGVVDTSHLSFLLLYGLVCLSAAWSALRLRLLPWYSPLAGGWCGTFEAGGWRSCARRACTMLVPAAVLAAAVGLQQWSASCRVRIDSTAERLFTLSRTTARLLGGVPGRIELRLYVRRGDPLFEYAEELAASVREVSRSRVAAEVVDPDLNPDLARRDGVTSYRCTVARMEGRRRLMEGLDETAVAAAVQAVLEGRRKVLFVRGHGERRAAGPEGTALFRSALRRCGFEISDSVVSAEAARRAAVMVVCGGKGEFTAAEMEIIERRLSSGGGLVLLLDDPEAGAWRMAGRFGTICRPAPDARPGGSASAGRGEGSVCLPASFHPVCRGLDATLLLKPLVLATLRSSRAVRWIPLLSCAGTTVAAAGELRLSSSAEADRIGRIVVVGDSDFAADRLFEYMCNASLAVRAVEWCARGTIRLHVPRLRFLTRDLYLDAPSRRFLYLFPTVGVTALWAGVGILLWIRRRRG